MTRDAPTLSIRLNCRDVREAGCDAARGWARLARAIIARVEDGAPFGWRFCGVRWVSQCKRPGVAALTAPGRFACLFGDLVPQAPDHAAA